MDAAEKRLLDTYRAGFWPFAMLYRDASGKQAEQWHKFQRLWVRPSQLLSHQSRVPGRFYRAVDAGTFLRRGVEYWK